MRVLIVYEDTYRTYCEMLEVTGVMMLVFAGLWYLLPLYQRLHQ